MPEIETERLLLRMFNPDEDADAMYGVWSDRETMRFIFPEGWRHPPEETRGMLCRLVENFETDGYGQWAVILKEEGRLIGYCGLKHFDDTNEVELLYCISHDYWNRGLVTEAARATMRFGFEEVGLPRIVALALPENVGSWRVMEKCGMERDGTIRHAGLAHVRYRLRREDFRPAREAVYLLRSSPQASLF